VRRRSRRANLPVNCRPQNCRRHVRIQSSVLRQRGGHGIGFHYARILSTMQVSLFYFGNDVFVDPSQRYRLLCEGAKFADEHGFTAVWTPERHFERFGGLYPNPCITIAALTTITKKVRLRAGSSIQPFHNAVCMAENWALLDNLSNGRIDVAFGSGWHVNDFVLAPDHYPCRREILFRDIATIQLLWKGETVELKNGIGNPVRIRTYPPPIQKELPIWITAHSDETFALAGRSGFNVLANFINKDNAKLKNKIRVYREAISETGKRGIVTLMVHAFVSSDRVQARDLGMKALTEYLTTNLELMAPMLSAESALSDPAPTMTKDDADYIAERTAARIIDELGLIGTPKECMEKTSAWESIGVDELACLIDFGIPVPETLEQMHNLVTLARQ